MEGIQVSPVRFEHLRAALGIGESSPRLSRRVESGPDRCQWAYEIEVDAERNRLESPESVLVPWPADPLRSRDRRVVRVRVSVTGANGRGFALERARGRGGRPAERGGLDRADDHSRCGSRPAATQAVPARQPVPRARLYITGHGLYRAEINGQPDRPRRVRSWLDQLPLPAALPDLRCDRPPGARRRRARGAAGSEAVSPSSRASATSTGTSWGCSSGWRPS